MFQLESKRSQKMAIDLFAGLQIVTDLLEFNHVMQLKAEKSITSLSVSHTAIIMGFDIPLLLPHWGQWMARHGAGSQAIRRLLTQ